MTVDSLGALRLSLALCLLVACGESDPPDRPRVPAEASEQETTQSEEPETVLPDRALRANPVAQTVGEVTVTASACSVDGEPIHYENFGTPGLAVTPDGTALFLVDRERALRRYTIVEGEECALTLDTTFGTGGALDLGFGTAMGGRVEGMATDAEGRVFVSSSMNGSVRVTDGQITRCAESRGGMTVAPDGSWGIAVFAGSVRRVTWTDEGCSVADYAYQEPYERASTFSFSGENLFITGSVGTNEFRAQRYNPAGEPQGIRWGGDVLADPDKICSPGNIVTGTRGPVVLDQNCRSLIVTTGDGEVAARINGMSLLGLRYPWIEALSEPRDGVAFLAVSHERAETTHHYDSYVFRVSGL